MPPRVLIAKPGLDGHDRGAKVVAYALRDAGFEVIYTGIRHKASEIVAVAIQEDVDVIGLSILSGAHISLTSKVVNGLKANGAHDIYVVVGGTIPLSDRQKLISVGAKEVYPTGTTIDELVAGIRSICNFPDTSKDESTSSSVTSRVLET
jgi:methylmalonyl-CoA mutase C-terminal domain/subunit